MRTGSKLRTLSANMATHIDWSHYTSDGDPQKGVNRFSDRFSQYLKELLIDVNKIKSIKDNFGKSSITPLTPTTAKSELYTTKMHSIFGSRGMSTESREVVASQWVLSRFLIVLCILIATRVTYFNTREGEIFARSLLTLYRPCRCFLRRPASWLRS